MNERILGSVKYQNCINVLAFVFRYKTLNWGIN